MFFTRDCSWPIIGIVDISMPQILIIGVIHIVRCQMAFDWFEWTKTVSHTQI